MSSAIPVHTAGSAAKRAPYAQSVPEFWAVIDGYEYALHESRPVSRAWVSTLRDAANAAWSIFAKTAQLIPFLDAATLLEMGLPPKALRILDNTVADLPVIFGRFDFIETPNGFRLIEFNAETPFFWVETHLVNGLACAHEGREDPNKECASAVIATMRTIAASLPQHLRYAVTANNVYREDYWTAKYIASLWEEALACEVPVVPIHELRTTASTLHHDGASIDVLHRCYPLEYVAADAGADALFALVQSGRATLVNPGAALFLQNKMTQALIWGLYERGEFFDRAEREMIERVFLPTYADPPSHGTWVRKPVLGREGNSIGIVRDGCEVISTPTKSYALQPMVYQQHVEPPQHRFRLSDGATHSGAAVTTCAVTGGMAGAVGMRVGGDITDGWAHFQPLSIES